MSIDGAGVRFADPLPIGKRGTLSFGDEVCEVEIKAHVANLDQDRCGLVFDDLGDEQRDAIQKMINALLKS